MSPFPSLHAYVEAEILPRYDAFDKAHRRPHVERVIRDALALAAFYPVDPEMVYAAAAFHDTGLCEGRETHHLASGRIIREDPELPRWFTPEQIETVAQAAEDHRASLASAPRSIYGRLIAEADRQIEPENIIRRTVQYGPAHNPEIDRAARKIRRRRLPSALDSGIAQRGETRAAPGADRRRSAPPHPVRNLLRGRNGPLKRNPSLFQRIFEDRFLFSSFHPQIRAKMRMETYFSSVFFRFPKKNLTLAA